MIKKTSRNYLILSLVVSFLAGLVIRFSWKACGIPHAWPPPGNPAPGAGLRFFSLWIPFIFVVFSFAAVALSSFLKGVDEKKIRRLDACTYLLLPVFILLELTWSHFGNWQMWFSVFYLLLVCLKSLFLLFFIYLETTRFDSAGGRVGKTSSGVKLEKRNSRNIKLSLVAVFFLIYAFFAGWQDLSVSTTGDEPYYLVITHSLVKDKDFDLSNNFNNREYNSFYWVKRLYPYQNALKTEDGKLFNLAYSGFGLFLLPAYALLKRLGAMLLISFFAALAAGEIFSFSLKATKSFKASFYSSLCVGLTSPLLFFSSQIYPEAVAAFFVIWAAGKISGLPNYQKHDLLKLACAIFILPLLQLRFVSLSLALFLLFLIYVRRKRVIIGTISAVIILTAAALLVDKFLFQGMFFFQRLHGTEGLVWYISRLRGLNGLRLLKNALALLFDQEFGLLLYSPLYLLAFFGLPFAFKENRRLLFITGFIIFVYSYFLERFGRWFGGFSLPCRYIVCILPLTGFLIAKSFEKIKLWSFKVFVLVLAMWSFIVSFLLLLKPLWKYNRFDGANRLLENLGRKFSADLVRFFPSFNGPTSSTYKMIMFFIVAVAIMGCFFYWRSRRPGEKQSAGNPVTFTLTLAVSILLLAGGFSAMVFMGRTVPTTVLEGESMLHSTGIIYTGYPTGAVWVMKKKGDCEDILILREGESEIELIAGGTTSDEILSRVTVFLDEEKVAGFDILAGEGEWRRESYKFRVTVPRGRHGLRIRFENGSTAVQRYLYIDKVIVHKLQ